MRSIATFRRKYNRTTSRSDGTNNTNVSIMQSHALDQPAKSPSNESIRGSINYNRSSPPGLQKSPTWSKSPRSRSFRSPVMNHQKFIAPTANSSIKIRSRSSSPHPRGHRRKPSHDLCTITEDRRISSNTLNKMAITTPAKQIALSPRINLTTHFYEPPQPKLKTRDTYNDDLYDHYRDDDDIDCNDCWAFKKSRFQSTQGCWFRSSERIDALDANKCNSSFDCNTR